MNQTLSQSQNAQTPETAALLGELRRMLRTPHARNTLLPGGGNLFISDSCSDENCGFIIMQPEGRTLISALRPDRLDIPGQIREIGTDLLYQSLTRHDPQAPLETLLRRRNRQSAASNLYGDRSSYAALDMALDHRTLLLSYSMESLPFYLIRENTVHTVCGSAPGRYPDPRDPLPLTMQQMQILSGDILIAPVYSNGKDQGKLSALLEQHSSLSADNLHRLLNTARTGCHALLTLQVEPADRCSRTVITAMEKKQVNSFIEARYNELEQIWQREGYQLPEIRLRTVLEEAVLNAWKHGHKETPGETITVEWASGNDFMLRITDNGTGFDPRDVPDPTKKENVTRLSGRGLFMIRHFSDSQRWNDSGRQIEIFFQRTATGTPNTDDLPDSNISLWPSFPD